MMTPRRLLAMVFAVLAVAVGVAGCGGSSSGGGASSAAPSIAVSASTGGGAATGSDQDFCNTFTTAKDRFGNIEGLPSKDDINQLKQYADDLDKTAPAEIKSDVAVLTAYFRYIADAVGNLGSSPTTEPSGLSDQMSKVLPAIAKISLWSATHCTGLASTAASAASAISSTAASAASAAASAAASVAASISAALSSALAAPAIS
jgi:hypothetical protein